MNPLNFDQSFSAGCVVSRDTAMRRVTARLLVAPVSSLC